MEEQINDDEQATTEYEELRQKAEENLRGWQRAAADFENYKRRDEQLHAELVNLTEDRVIMQFLELSEDFDRTLAHLPQGVEGLEEWKKGLEGVRKRLQDTLKRLKVAKIETTGQPFDHDLHEALMQVEGEQEGQIAEEISAGYIREGRLLKPAQVKVIKSNS